jgi:pimeloyl-ACP methyl ester carboxylesterase
MNDNFFALKNGKICYQQDRGKGKTIVFLHGAGGSLSGWDRIKTYFSRTDFNCLYIDLYGHGYSDRSSSLFDYSIEHHCQNLDEILNGLGIKNIIIIGHCLGAIIGTTYASCYPQKVIKLVLVNPGQPNKSPLLLRSIRFLLPFFYRLTKILRLDKPINIKRVNYQNYINSFDLSPRRLWADISATGISHCIGHIMASFNWNGQQYFPKIKCPTLIIGGKKDIIFPGSVSLNIQDQIINSRLEILDTNHISIINNPEEVYEKISGFLLSHNTDS